MTTCLEEAEGKFRSDDADPGTFIGAVLNFETLERKLAEELKSAPTPLSFEFLSGQIDRSADRLARVPLPPTGFIPRNGDSMGPQWRCYTGRDIWWMVTAETSEQQLDPVCNDML